ncbi:protein PAXX [Scyliorhinus canicula]|uniref:protein PAXX n=1 Tax=Scyliorhinus canicula TaxID=7830 RepID=UPI0018F6F353|nr:protein PAXX [Scyliorhinus canicula]XP_038638074.1 protein PAXX [Scyliorhinus canicula]XP_038638075.1 protein PAXX [Scyliorhinus canicula]XP_038638076.1 protein PAXX [Scyliorhinus canicula]
MEAEHRLPSIGSLHIHTLPESHQRYLCYTHPGTRSFNLCVTNVVDVWSTGFSAQKLEEHKSAHGVKTAEEYHSRTRVAFQKAAVSLTVLDNITLLKFSQDDLGLTFDLYKLPIPEAKTEIQSVMFHLVDQIHHLENQLKAAEESNALNLEKTMQRTQRMFLADYDSKRKGNGPESSLVAKKRPAGESLINPGSKRTMAPTGVSFEDNTLESDE